MNRRGFFKLFSAGVAGIAIEKAIPFGRVWSFPSKIVVPETGNYFLTHEEVAAAFLRVYAESLDRALSADAGFWDRRFGKPLRVGQTITVKFPARYSARVADRSLFLPA
jgi:hypothetical protein